MAVMRCTTKGLSSGGLVHSHLTKCYTPNTPNMGVSIFSTPQYMPQPMPQPMPQHCNCNCNHGSGGGFLSKVGEFFAGAFITVATVLGLNALFGKKSNTVETPQANPLPSNPVQTEEDKKAKEAEETKKAKEEAAKKELEDLQKKYKDKGVEISANNDGTYTAKYDGKEYQIKDGKNTDLDNAINAKETQNAKDGKSTVEEQDPKAEEKDKDKEQEWHTHEETVTTVGNYTLNAKGCGMSQYVAAAYNVTEGSTIHKEIMDKMWAENPGLQGTTLSIGQKLNLPDVIVNGTTYKPNLNKQPGKRTISKVNTKASIADWSQTKTMTWRSQGKDCKENEEKVDLKEK